MFIQALAELLNQRGQALALQLLQVCKKVIQRRQPHGPIDDYRQPLILAAERAHDAIGSVFRRAFA